MACEVCDGSGEYPVITSKGQQIYCIRCPECFGTGQSFEEPPPPVDPPDWPPTSTAAKIKTMDELRAHLARQRAS